MEPKKFLMVTVSGPDRPGITAELTRVLMEHEVELLDIEQASPHKLLGLYFLLDLGPEGGAGDSVIKDLLFEASRLGLTLDFRLYSENEVQAASRPNLFVLTHFGGIEALAAISKILGEEKANIETISTAFHHGCRSMEMIVQLDGSGRIGRLKERVMRKSRELGVDLALQKMEAYRKNKRLILFDMDSTLIDMEILDEVARRAQVFREVARVTERAMRGDFDFEESLRQRVALLKGVTVETLKEIRDRMRISEGVEELVTTLRWLGYRMGVLTGGFHFFADHLKETLGLDFAFANRLEVKDGVLTGRVEGAIIDAAGKAQIVNRLSCDLGIPLDQVVVVGDGANDVLMLGQAGLGIAYNAKNVLDGVATAALGKRRLSNILHLLAVTEEDIAEAVSCKEP